LNSPRAIAINIEIMRAFVQVRSMAATHQDLAKQLTELQDKTESLAMSHETFSRNTKAQLREVFETLHELMTPPASPKRPIGFVHPQDAAKPKGKAVKASAAKKAAIAAPAKAARKK
jgi:two-component sensor histidine kinase